MKKFERTLGVILAITMLFTLMPMGMVCAADEEDYQVAAGEITFADFKGTGNSNGQFDIIDDLDFISEYAAADGKTYEVSWESSDESVISNTGELVATDLPTDRWVTISAIVKDDDSDNTKTRTIKVCVKAAVAEEDVLFYENFEGFELSEGKYTFTDMGADADENDWYVTIGNASYPNYTDGNTLFTVRDNVLENLDLTVSGKVLRMDAVTTGAMKNHMLTNDFVSSMPESGIITYSADVIFSGTSTNFFFWPFFFEKTTNKIKFPFSNGGTQSTTLDYSFGQNVWYNITTVYNLSKNTVTGYVNGTEFASAEIPSTAFAQLPQLKMRLYENANDYTFVDNIKVTKRTFEAEEAALAAFNPMNPASDYKDSTIVNMDLNNSINIAGTDYDVIYASSDESVISSTGEVSLSDFIRTVTVTPQISVDGTLIGGTETVLTVLPIESNYSRRLFENFEDIDVITEAAEGVEVGDMFKADGTAVDADCGWSINAPANYVTEYAAGSRNKIITENGNKVLQMNRVVSTSQKDYRMQISTPNPQKGDRIAIAFRMKLMSGSSAKPNFSANYLGAFSTTRGGLRGDFGKVSTDTDLALSFDNEWHTYLAIYDTGIMETKKNGDAYPVSLYIDGVYQDTTWARQTYTDGTAFQMTQWAEYGNSNILIDDILLMNFDSKDIQLAGTTVADGVVTKADVQCVSYETTMPGEVKLLAAAYNSSDELICAKVVNANVTAVGDNESDLGLDITGAAYYRLFVFDGLTNIKPLALSKIYNIAE